MTDNLRIRFGPDGKPRRLPDDEPNEIVPNPGGFNRDHATALRTPGSDAYGSFEWNGGQGVADDVRYNGLVAAATRNRQGPQMNMTQDALGRGMQTTAASGYQSMMNGTGPTMATGQLNGAMASNAGAASRAAASGNPAAIANAINGAGNAGANVSRGVASTRADEYNRAFGGLSMAASNIYDSDLANQKLAADNFYKNRSSNDTLAGAYDDNTVAMNGVQMNSGLARENIRMGAVGTQYAYDRGMQQIKNDEASRNLNAGLRMAGSIPLVGSLISQTGDAATDSPDEDEDEGL